MSYLDIAAREGLRLVVGGAQPDDPALGGGLYVRPTLYEDVPATSRLLREEIFGPVLVVIPFDDYDDALRIANDVAYGLSASVFTNESLDGSLFRARYRGGLRLGQRRVSPLSRLRALAA
jgi:acyl-CoA reductase-like NAD-dependent aldehyde dehydrogenase